MPVKNSSTQDDDIFYMFIIFNLEFSSKPRKKILLIKSFHGNQERRYCIYTSRTFNMKLPAYNVIQVRTYMRPYKN